MQQPTGPAPISPRVNSWKSRARSLSWQALQGAAYTAGAGIVTLGLRLLLSKI